MEGRPPNSEKVIIYFLSPLPCRKGHSYFYSYVDTQYHAICPTSEQRNTGAPSTIHSGQTAPNIPSFMAVFRNFLPFDNPWVVSHYLLDLVQRFFLTVNPCICLHFISLEVACCFLLNRRQQLSTSNISSVFDNLAWDLEARKTRLKSRRANVL